MQALYGCGKLRLGLTGGAHPGCPLFMCCAALCSSRCAPRVWLRLADRPPSVAQLVSQKGGVMTPPVAARERKSRMVDLAGSKLKLSWRKN